MTPLRLGVVGCGAVTERYHLPALLAAPDVQVVAFVDPDVERAGALASRFPGAAALPGHEDLRGRVDAVLLAAPNPVHATVGAALLADGVSLLVEKPMARTAAECDRLLEAAASSGAVLAVGHDFRHFPVARFTRQFFAARTLGDVRRVDVRQSAGGRWPHASPSALSPEAGGGVLLDFGVHLLDLLLWWLGDMRPVSARDDARGGIETECELELELAGGAPVVVELSRTRDLRDTVVVECERGTVEIGVFEPAVVRLTPGGGDVAVTGAVADDVFARAPLPTVFGRQLAEFVRAVRGGPSSIVTGAEGRRVVALAEACYALRQPWRMPWDYPEAYSSVGGPR
ncbi:Gfo/Idh/MocA family protein [Geodermatophilus sp. SYSU D00684]